MPSSGARHRPLKTKTGLEGTFLHKKIPKKGAVNVNKNMHVGLERKLKEAEAILAEEDVPIDCPPPLYSGTTQRIFPRNYSSCCFGYKEVPWL